MYIQKEKAKISSFQPLTKKAGFGSGSFKRKDTRIRIRANMSRIHNTDGRCVLSSLIPFPFCVKCPARKDLAFLTINAPVV
jgi:hypothetical protein